jgi:hypothetical protein
LLSWLVSTDFGTYLYQRSLYTFTLILCICWSTVEHTLYRVFMYCSFIIIIIIIIIYMQSLFSWDFLPTDCNVRYITRDAVCSILFSFNMIRYCICEAPDHIWLGLSNQGHWGD